MSTLVLVGVRSQLVLKDLHGGNHCVSTHTELHCRQREAVRNVLVQSGHSFQLRDQTQPDPLLRCGSAGAQEESLTWRREK